MDASLVLSTDLYELTMFESYVVGGLRDRAAFELFVRNLPPTRAFLVASGLERALSFLESAKFSSQELDVLAGTVHVSSELAKALAAFRFTGDVDAVPEGTIVFPDEPLLRVVAPLPEAQLVETVLLNFVHYQTVVASKAVRSVTVAAGKTLVDFGLRRAHGLEAGLWSARAAHIAGFDGTSNVLAGVRFGIPLFGTMAHSFVEAHDSEAAAFQSFARTHPEGTTLLIDTYDTERAAATIVELAPRLAAQGVTLGGVRIDSGNLLEQARLVRSILDRGGLAKMRIVASGGLDERDVDELVGAGAPIDGFGLGTKINTSADAPYLDCAYKLVEYAGRPRRKRSEQKATWPGKKQVYRRFTAHGTMSSDSIALEGERCEGEPLLRKVMSGGARIDPPESLANVRARVAAGLASLPQELRRLDGAPAYRVGHSRGLIDVARRLDEQ